jgi:4-hydroxybenzoate polyprenyltransferase
MFSRSSWLHLRIPFSYFLLPVFLFSVCISPNFIEGRLFWVFFIVHFLLYPASNGYNSYFDKDEKSIGGLKNPPPVNKGLYYLSLYLDMLAIILGFITINLTFAIMLLVYGLVSKAYSHPAIRIKKYPVSGWIITGLFQGMFSILMCYVGINDFSIDSALNEKVLWTGVLATCMLWANYPMTQVYQHEEDAKRGDKTFSLMLGIRGTFYFVGAVFGLVTVGFVLYFNHFYSMQYGIVFLAALFPVVAFFGWWFLKVLHDEASADFQNTMRLNFISATCLNIFFLYVFLSSTHVLQLFL